MTEELRISCALDAISKSANGTKALEILSIITYFAPENIHAETLSSIVNDGKELGAAVALLKEYSIVYLGPKDTIINIDRTAQKIMTKIMDKENQKSHVLKKALAMLFMQGINSNNLDHVMSAWSYVSPYPQLIEKFSGIPSLILCELNKQIRYKEGETFGWKALDLLNKTVGQSHPGTWVLQHNMGLLLGMMGKHKKALEILLPLYEQNMDHSGLRDTLISIARQLSELSRFDEALKIYQETLFCNQKVSDSNDDLMLSAWHDYAHILSETGKHYEASEILKDILKRRKQIVKTEDPDTLSLKSSLAHVLVKESKYAEAFKIFHQIYKKRKETFGDNHVITLRSRRDIALVFQHQGKFDTALAIYEEVTEIFKQVLGIDHPETLAIQANTATLFQQRGEYQKALETYKYIYKKQSETLGERHVDPLRVKYHIATILFIQEKHDEALIILQEVYEAYIEVFGANHPKTLDLKTTLETLNSVKLETIYSAAWEGNSDKIIAMSQSGIDINNPDFGKKTPLHYAAECGHTDVVKLLLEKGAIYNGKSEVGKTPFQTTSNSEIKNLFNLVAKLIKDAREGNHEQVSKHIAKERGIVNAKDNDGSNALHWAAYNGHKDIVKLLLESGADATLVTDKGNTPLHIATSKGHKEIIEVLLQCISRGEIHSFINAKTTAGGLTSIHVAAKNGSLDIVKTLLKHGAIYNIKNKQGKTPAELSKDRNITNLLKLSDELFQDAKNGNPQIINKLQHVEPDAFIALTQASNDQGNTLLQVLISNEHFNITHKMLEMVRKPDETESRSSTKRRFEEFHQLSSAAKLHIRFSDQYLSILRSMSQSYDSEKNPSPWKTVKEGSYYLANAYRLVEVYKKCIPGPIDNKDIKAVDEMLVELGFDPKHITEGYTDEAYGGQVECFVSKGQGTKYYELLHSELKKDVRSFVELVKRKIDVPVKRFLESLEELVKPKPKSVGSEKLFKAIENNNHTEVEDCISKGMDVNSKNIDGGTPLHFACNSGNISIINSLLKNGADVTSVTSKGNTPLHIATSKGHAKIVEVLLQHASSDKLDDLINAKTTIGGTTALHVAAKNGSVDIVNSLLKYGARFNIENKEGKRPLDLSKDPIIVDLLKTIYEVFHAAKIGFVPAAIALMKMLPDEFSALTQARDNQGNTLLQVAIIYKRKNFENAVLEVYKKRDAIDTWCSLRTRMDQFEELKKSAEAHIRASKLYIPKLRSMSQLSEPDNNYCPSNTLKEGSYYLGSAHSLVKLYKKYMNCGSIDDKNIQAVNDMLVEFQFDQEYNTVGYKDDVSKGQGTRYHELLHSEFKKDVRLFIEKVERNIDIPVKRFLASITQRLESALPEKLFKAIESNNQSEVEYFIRAGKGNPPVQLVNSKNADGATPLHYAVNNENIGIINILLKNGADASQVTAKGNTPLHIATSKNHKEIVEILLEHASHNELYDLINARTTLGGTASLHVAAKNGSVDVVISLLNHGAIYDIKNKDGKTPLDLAKDGQVINVLILIEKLFEDAKNGDFEIISDLEHTELDVFVALSNARNNEGNTFLQVAMNNKYKNITSEFLDLFKKPDQIHSLSSPKCKLEQFAMLQEVADVHLKASRINLLELRRMSQPCVSEKNPSPWTTLKDGSQYLGNAHSLVEIYKWCTNTSIDNEDIQTVNDVLTALEFDPKHIASYTNEVCNGGADCFVSKGQGAEYYKLLHSEWKQDVRIFVELVERNIEVPVKKFLESMKQKLQDVVPEKLFLAIDTNSPSEVENCIREGAFVNIQHTDGATPLHYAVNNGNLEIINILLKNDADITEVTDKGNTPLHVATSKGHSEIVEVLLQNVSRDKFNEFINAQTIGGTTSLHIAAIEGLWDIVKSLLRHGAIHNIKNIQGKTPLDLSKDRNIGSLLNLVGELFEDAKNGNPRLISKLRQRELDEFIVITNARNDKGQTLLQVVKANHHKSIANIFSKILANRDQTKSCFAPKFSLGQIEKLKSAAELYIQSSESYLTMLRNSSVSNRSEKISFPWATLKAGSCYLQNVHSLVAVYKGCTHGSIDDKNIQTVNSILVELEFDPKHITLGYTDEAFNGKVECFVSKGQGTKYYELLHSDLKKDVRLFIKMVELNVDIPVKEFLNSIKKELQSILSEMLFQAIESNNNLEVRSCLREELVVNSSSTDGRIPLHCAVNTGNISIINTLLKHGADVSQLDYTGESVLHIASSNGNKRIVEGLLQHVGDEKLNDFINARITFDGTTSLHVAAKNGSLEVVETLLKHGAIYNIKNKENKTALDLSKDQNVTNLLKLIEILFEDAKCGNFKIIRKLKTQPYKFTAIANTRNDQGKSLVQVAISNKHQALAGKIEMIIKTRTNSQDIKS